MVIELNMLSQSSCSERMGKSHASKGLIRMLMDSPPFAYLPNGTENMCLLEKANYLGLAEKVHIIFFYPDISSITATFFRNYTEKSFFKPLFRMLYRILTYNQPLREEYTEFFLYS